MNADDQPIDGPENEIDPSEPSAEALEEDEPDFELTDRTPAEFIPVIEDFFDREWSDDEFEVFGAGVYPMKGMWMLVPAGWAATERTDDWDDHEVIRWATDLRSELASAWGPAGSHTPKPPTVFGDPGSILDTALASFGGAAPLVWTRGDHVVVLTDSWNGEPGNSTYGVLLFVMPQSIYDGGIAATQDSTSTVEDDGLFHGESLAELRRRAVLISTGAGRGAETVLTPEEGEVGAIRCGYRLNAVTWGHWLFTDDDRALLLVLNTTTHGLLDPDDDREAALEQLRLLYTGVPDELLDLMSRPASLSTGSISEFDGYDVNGMELPRISGAFWYGDGAWHTSAGLLEFGLLNGVGIDDVGFVSAVRRPLRLGGDFTVEHMMLPGWVDRRDEAEVDRALEHFRAAFDAAPAPGERPEGSVRLGRSVPAYEIDSILDDVETTAAAWWDDRLRIHPEGDEPFTVGGRTLDRDDRHELTTPFAYAEEWNADVFDEWRDTLFEAATARWGEPFELTVEDAGSGRTIRTPFTRPLRANGYSSALCWWVDGLVVSFPQGRPPRWDMMPDEWHLSSSRPGPLMMLHLTTAEGIVEPFEHTHPGTLRNLLQTMGSLHGTKPDDLEWDATPIGARAGRTEQRPDLFAHTTAPARRWTFLAAAIAVPGEVQVWHSTHDGRFLLLTRSETSPIKVVAIPGFAEAGAEPPMLGPASMGPRPPIADARAFAQLEALYEGVPDDLMSLVRDRPESEESALPLISDGSGGTLPAATGIYWFDGTDWIVADGLLCASHDFLSSPGRKADRFSEGGRESKPDSFLMNGIDGLWSASRSIGVGLGLDPESVETDQWFFRGVLGREIDRAELTAAMRADERTEDIAELETFNDFHDNLVQTNDLDHLIASALSNPDPVERRRIFLWLVGGGTSAKWRSARTTPLVVLFDNEILDPESDALLVAALYDGGVADWANDSAPRVRGGGHPVEQLCDQDLTDEEMEPLHLAYFDPRFVDVDALAVPDGRTAEQYIADGGFAHDRSGMLALLRRSRTARAALRAELAEAGLLDTDGNQTAIS